MAERDEGGPGQRRCQRGRQDHGVGHQGRRRNAAQAQEVVLAHQGHHNGGGES